MPANDIMISDCHFRPFATIRLLAGDDRHASSSPADVGDCGVPVDDLLDDAGVGRHPLDLARVRRVGAITVDVANQGHRLRGQLRDLVYPRRQIRRLGHRDALAYRAAHNRGIPAAIADAMVPACPVTSAPHIMMSMATLLCTVSARWQVGGVQERSAPTITVALDQRNS